MKTTSRTRAREGTTPPAAEQSEGQVLLSAAAERLVDVAERLHVGVSTVSDWRRGAKSPGGHARKRLAEVYGIPPGSWDRPARSMGMIPDAEPMPPLELDSDAPPLESTLRQVDRLLVQLTSPGATDEDRKHAESLRKLLKDRGLLEKDKRVIDQHIERALLDPSRQRFYTEHTEALIDTLRRERATHECGCMAAVEAMLEERIARKSEVI